jgi:hypothetical protein
VFFLFSIFPIPLHFFPSLLCSQVLVHCYAGVSRSVSLVVAWLMRHHRLSYKQAKVRVQRRRPLVNPNHGFRQQLKAFAQVITDSATFSTFVTDSDNLSLLFN